MTEFTCVCSDQSALKPPGTCWRIETTYKHWKTMSSSTQPRASLLNSYFLDTVREEGEEKQGKPDSCYYSWISGCCNLCSAAVSFSQYERRHGWWSFFLSHIPENLTIHDLSAAEGRNFWQALQCKYRQIRRFLHHSLSVSAQRPQLIWVFNIWRRYIASGKSIQLVYSKFY